MPRIGLFLSMLTTLLLTSCSTLHDPKEKLVLNSISYQELPGWLHDDHGQALEVFLNSCERMLTLPSSRNVHKTGLGGSYGDWENVCTIGKNIGHINPTMFFEEHFTPHKVSSDISNSSQGLFTGYYEPGLYGSRTRHSAFQNPLYKKPPQLDPKEAFFSRSQINQGKLDNQDLELVWVNDPVKSFFLHIQGSGLIWLDDGTHMRVGYDGKNNHAYTSLGKYMIEQGWLTRQEVTAQSIKKWLFNHPHQSERIMEENASYIFFKDNHTSGPIGAQGVELTPMRSLAVDKHLIPYGIPIWLNTTLNGGHGYPEKPFQHLMIAQDTGGAIRGAVRGDIFFGNGDMAESYAGTQNSVGEYYVLLPNHSTTHLALLP